MSEPPPAAAKLALVEASSEIVALMPGLLLIGLGLGVMLTPSVNVVQSAFGAQQQDEISGLSRSVSNLGSSLGTAIAGTILVADLASGNTGYVVAMIALAAIALIGLGASLLPNEKSPAEAGLSHEVAGRRFGASRTSWASSALPN